MKRRRKVRMYAVSCDGIGIISGTLAYSRRDAIRHFQGGGLIVEEWQQAKALGYRTVKADVRVIERRR